VIILANRTRKGIIRWGAASGVIYLLALLGPVLSPRYHSDPRVQASIRLMQQSFPLIRQHREKLQIPIDPFLDPNQTGLIGPRTSPLTTTLGSLPAKRTTTNPQLAGLVTSLLIESGLRKGQKVAIGASGSFPALLIASLAAVKTLGLKPVLIISLGSSSYGAGHPRFHLLDLVLLLNRSGLFPAVPAAVSLGGERDVGTDFPLNFRSQLIQEIEQMPTQFIYEPVLARNVQQRMKIYRQASPEQSVALFINIGGSHASLGTSSRVLHLDPGLNTDARLPDPGQRGMIFAMLAEKIPCLHLLFIKGLAQRHSLPWDPVPLPEGTNRPFPVRKSEGWPWLIVLLIIQSVIPIILWPRS